LRGFTEYSDLVAALLVAEQNNELLIKKNHQLHPTRTMTYPEINATTFNQGCGGYSRQKERGGHARFDGRG